MDEAGSRRGAWSGPRVYGGLVVVLVVTAVLVAWLLSRNVSGTLGYLEPEVTAVSVAVSDVAVDHSSTASLAVTYEDAVPLLGSGRVGTVTGIGVRPGDEITQGQVVYEVDALPVRGYVGQVVFYRPLQRGSAGEDVQAAQELLNSLTTGTSIQADGRFGAKTEQAVRSYERSLGLEPSTGVFDPTWFVRLPHSGFTVAELSLLPGEPAPAPADAFATGAPAILAAGISTGASPPDGDYEFVSQGRSVPVTRAGGEWNVALDRVISVLSLTPGQEPPTQVEGIVRLVEGLPAQSVPPVALINATEPVTCVATVQGDTVSLDRVELLGSHVSGVALISADLFAGAEVLVNPHAMGHDSCP